MHALALLLVACTAPPAEKLDPPSTTYEGSIPTVTVDTTTTVPAPTGVDECGDDPVCTNLWELPYHWTTDGPAELYLAELTGDGLTDALVNVWSGDTVRAFVVAGPLARDVRLPDDADGEIVVDFAGTGGAAMPVGDLDGDGSSDVAVTESVGNLSAVYAGPFVGVVEVSARAPISGVPWHASMYDLDADGYPELIHFEESAYDGRTQVQVFDGPFDPASEPVLTVDPLCDDGEYDYYYGGNWDPYLAMEPSDVDGDGVLDLAFDVYWFCAAGSGTFTVSGAARGRVHETSPGILFDAAAGSVGDVDGDGATDAWAESGWSGVEPGIFAGPLAPGAELLGQPAASLSHWHSLSGGRILSVAWAEEETSVVVYDGALTGGVLERWPVPWNNEAIPRYFPDLAPELVFFIGEEGISISVIEP